MYSDAWPPGGKKNPLTVPIKLCLNTQRVAEIRQVFFYLGVFISNIWCERVILIFLEVWYNRPCFCYNFLGDVGNVSKQFDISRIHLNYIMWVLNLADVSEHHPPDVVNGVSQGIILFQRLSKAEHMKCHIGPSYVWVFVGTAMQKPWLFRICCLFSQSRNVWEKIPQCKRLTVWNLW